ncbi:MAG: LemA family protein [Lachnospiraceae bacterium]|nr:LemA family protein [Lachnospiraceae bacterium]
MEYISIIVWVIIVIVVWYITTLNSIKRAALKVDEADSGIDVALTKRYDVLTKMLDTVKGYQQYEKSTLTEMIQLRNGMSISEKNQANKAMDQMTNNIRVLAEAYPELRANVAFVKLQDTIADVEEHLQAARRLYNANVNTYNSKLVVFPSSIVAHSMGAMKRDLFVADDEKRQDVEMRF